MCSDAVLQVMLGMGQEWHHMACPVSLQAHLLRQLEEHLLWPLPRLQGGPRARGSCPHCLRVHMQGCLTVLRYCLHSCCVNPHSCSISPHSCCISPHSCCVSPHSCCVSSHSCCVSPHAGATRHSRDVPVMIQHSSNILAGLCALSCLEPATFFAVLGGLS